MEASWLLLFAYALLALGVSFLCSLLEAALLSVPHSHVAVLVERGTRTGRRLQQLKREVDRPLSAILTLNTVAHTVGAAGVGAEAAVLFGHAAVGVASAVMTLLILVLSEIIPKTLGAVHARRLAGFTTFATLWLIRLTYPIVVALEGVNRLIGYKRGEAKLQRHELLATLQLGWRAGALDSREHQTIRNLMSLDNVTVERILTPRTVVMALPQDATVDAVLAEHRSLRFARMPVYASSLDEVTGYVMRFEIYEAACRGRGQTPLTAMIRPLRPIPEQASVAAALETMLQHREHILLAVSEYGGTEGIVTLEDVMETLLGLEIVDESDPTVDLRELARRRSRPRGADHESDDNTGQRP